MSPNVAEAYRRSKVVSELRIYCMCYRALDGRQNAHIRIRNIVQEQPTMIQTLSIVKYKETETRINTPIQCGPAESIRRSGDLPGVRNVKVSSISLAQRAAVRKTQKHAVRRIEQDICTIRNDVWLTGRNERNRRSVPRIEIPKHDGGHRILARRGSTSLYTECRWIRVRAFVLCPN